jgi:hypothetical protein
LAAEHLTSNAERLDPEATRLGQFSRVIVSLTIKNAARTAMVGRERTRNQPTAGRFAKEEIYVIVAQSRRNPDPLSGSMPP